MEPLMPTTLQKLRTNAFRRQSGCCYYCKQPMWIDDINRFAAANELTLRQARGRQCTAEHLVARQDGGTDTSENIAAACWICNQRRHKRSRPGLPDDYRTHVQRRVAQGRWHQARSERIVQGDRRPVPASPRR